MPVYIVAPSRWHGSALTLTVTLTADTQRSSSMPRSKAFLDTALRYSGYICAGKLSTSWSLEHNHLYRCVATVVLVVVLPPQLAVSQAVPRHRAATTPTGSVDVSSRIGRERQFNTMDTNQSILTGLRAREQPQQCWISWCRRWGCSSRRRKHKWCLFLRKKKESHPATRMLQPPAPSPPPPCPSEQAAASAWQWVCPPPLPHCK